MKPIKDTEMFVLSLSIAHLTRWFPCSGLRFLSPQVWSEGTRSRPVGQARTGTTPWQRQQSTILSPSNASATARKTSIYGHSVQGLHHCYSNILNLKFHLQQSKLLERFVLFCVSLFIKYSVSNCFNP